MVTFLSGGERSTQSYATNDVLCHNRGIMRAEFVLKACDGKRLRVKNSGTVFKTLERGDEKHCQPSEGFNKGRAP